MSVVFAVFVVLGLAWGYVALPASALSPTAHTTPPGALVPPNNPPSNSIVSDCDSGNDVGCLAEINAARASQEDLGPLTLPSNWTSLTAPEQMFVIVNLERTTRGEPPIPDLVNTYDSEVLSGIANETDPALSEIPFGQQSGSIWAGGWPTVLGAMAGWMYDDGLGGFNGDCTTSDESGCWVHRDIILSNPAYFGNPQEMDAGTAFFGGGTPGYAAIFTDYSGNTPYFTWAQEFLFLDFSVGTTTLPTGTLNTSYSTALSASGGTPPYTWSIISGSLPPGLTLNPTTGAITGTPTAIGTSDFKVQVTDSNSLTASESLSIRVIGEPTVTVASTSPTQATSGTTVTYSSTVTSGSGTPTGTVTFTVGTTTLCTTGTLSSGMASCTASNAPVGVDAVIATYSGNSTLAISSGTTTLTVFDNPGPYTPLAPVRICDTRPGNQSDLSGDAAQCNGGTGNPGSTIAAGGTLTINVAGEFGVPADATAVVLNVTAVARAKAGYLTVFPASASEPFASNINYLRATVVPNLVEVGTGTTGEVSIYSSAQSDVVVDLEGYVSPTSLSGAGLYVPLPSPVRICDTRPKNPSGLTSPDNQCNGGTTNPGETLAAGGTINVQVAGINDIPVGATAAVFNVTVTNPKTAGYLTMFPRRAMQPVASNVNYAVGQVTANRVTVPLSTGEATPGYVTVYSSASANVIIDVSGYYTATGGTGAQFTPEPAPVRICDTRPGNPSGLTGGAAQCNGFLNLGRTVSAGGTLTLNVDGLASVPSNATAVVVNLTGVSPSAPSFLTVFPTSLPSPLVSDLNELSGNVRANLVVATLSPTGTISIYNDAGSIDVVVDVLGWYS